MSTSGMDALFGLGIGVGILLWILIMLIPAIIMGSVVKNLAQKKGYKISFAWGFFFGMVAFLYWGLAPTHPELQAQIIAEGIRRTQLAQPQYNGQQ